MGNHSALAASQSAVTAGLGYLYVYAIFYKFIYYLLTVSETFLFLHFGRSALVFTFLNLLPTQHFIGDKSLHLAIAVWQFSPQSDTTWISAEDAIVVFLIALRIRIEMQIIHDPILHYVHLWHIHRQARPLPVPIKEVRRKECLLRLCQRIGIKIHEAYKVETVRLAVHSEIHVVEQSLLLCYLPVAAQHLYHIVDSPIAAHHHRCENLQSLWFRLYHSTLKRIYLMMHERFIKVKHPYNIVIVECICNNSRHLSEDYLFFTTSQ